MESLLQGLSGVLCLAAVALKVLLSFQAAPVSGSGLFCGVSCTGDRGEFLRSVGIFCSCSMHKRTRQRPFSHA
jgi:hypothetical protein